MQVKLSDLKPGAIAKVVKTTGEPSSRKRMIDLGIVKDVTLQITRVAPFGDPIEILVRGYKLSLCKNAAAQILVEVSK